MMMPACPNPFVRSALSREHDPIQLATPIAVPPYEVRAIFLNTVIDPGQESHWTCLRASGLRAACSAIAVNLGWVKLGFWDELPGSPVVAVTYDNARGTAYDNLLLPLITGNDFPVV
jgi:hypothetical protein